jgi:superfamily I DNA/RNA helicase
VDSAKGLEFDYVVVPDATADAYPPTDDARRRLHVAVTRTSHQLWIVSGGRPSVLVSELRDQNPAVRHADEASGAAQGPDVQV